MIPKFTTSGNRLYVAPSSNLSELKEGDVYNINIAQTGLYLTNGSPFSTPSKMYGHSEILGNRINKAYKHIGKTMGVLFAGRSGAGKSVDARVTALMAGLPILTITSSVVVTEDVEQFITFLQDIPESVIYIDEFEKVFSPDSREVFLTILDGNLSCKHLFVLTSNESEVGKFFIGRPGRIRYVFEYDGLGKDLIEEVIKDKLLPQYIDLATQVRDACMLLPSVTMDILVTIIDEVNIFGESPTDFTGFLNVHQDSFGRYDIEWDVMLKHIPFSEELLVAMSTDASFEVTPLVLENINDYLVNEYASMDELTQEYPWLTKEFLDKYTAPLKITLGGTDTDPSKGLYVNGYIIKINDMKCGYDVIKKFSNVREDLSLPGNKILGMEKQPEGFFKILNIEEREVRVYSKVNKEVARPKECQISAK